MKPIVTTVNVIRLLASGLADVALDETEVIHRTSTQAAEYLLHAEDTSGSQRIILHRRETDLDGLLPAALSRTKREAYSRVATFTERARTFPVTVPSRWSQYKYNNLIAFFAASPVIDSSARWIAEVTSDSNADCIFWELTTSDRKLTLEDFDENYRDVNLLPTRDEWSSVLASAAATFSAKRAPSAAGEDIYLPGMAPTSNELWSYDRWTAKLSDDQRLFLESPTQKSIRLRGPAGSGKTLALVMKALRESFSNEGLRVLIVTHSWAVAGQIDELVRSMGVTDLPQVDILPLLEVAKALSPAFAHGDNAEYGIWGEDSLSGKQAQLDQIGEICSLFMQGDWIAYKNRVNDTLRERFESPDQSTRDALVWDLLHEFGSVIGAAAIFPGAGAEARYLDLSTRGLDASPRK